MMEHMDDYVLYNTDREETESEEECFQRFVYAEHGSRRFYRFFVTLLPKRLICVIIISAVFLYRYYLNNCIKDADGGMVSKPMYLPGSVTFNPFKFLFASLEDASGKPFWTMPGTGDDD